MNAEMSSALWRKTTWLLLAAGFFFGFTIIALLPPFEGMDETAHFSRLQSQIFAAPVPQDQMQKEENAPRLTQDVFDYYRQGPMPYHWIGFEAQHQRDPLRGYMTYRDFFDTSARATDYIRNYRQSVLQPGYRPGPEFNWEYQHPALYYILVGQPMKFLAGRVSLVSAFLVLRMMSWSIAFAGFCIGLFATRAHLTRTHTVQAEILTAMGAFYPFLAPAFFWEFARLGNDSLCLFLFGVSWAFLLWYLRAPRSDAGFYLGFFLGLGWLTKALMIPVAAGVMVFVVLHSFWVVRKDPLLGKGWWLPPLKVVGFVALIGAPVYIINYLAFGSWGPRVFTAIMTTQDSFSLLQQNFSFHALKAGLQEIFYMAVWWAGTWSFMIVDLPLHLMLYVFTASVVVSYLWTLQKFELVFQLPLWAILPMLFGLIAHVVIVIIIQNDDNTPGYYLHILAPAWALIYGLGLKNLLKWRSLRGILGGLFVLICALDFFVVAGYASAFAGCAVASPTLPPFYVGRPATLPPFYLLRTADILQCAGHMPLIFERLGVLAWPGLALGGLGLTFIALSAAGALVCKQKVSLS